MRRILSVSLSAMALAGSAYAQQTVVTSSSTANGVTTQIATTTPTGAAAQQAAAAAQSAQLGVTNTALGGAPASGAVTLGTSAGVLESNILTAISLNAAGHDIIAQAPTTGFENAVVITGSSAPDLSAYQTFDLARSALLDLIKGDEKLLNAALDESETPPEQPAGAHTSLLADLGVLTGVETVTKALPLLATDYQLGGLTITPDNYALAVALVNRKPAWQIATQLDVTQNLKTIRDSLKTLQTEANSARALLVKATVATAALSAVDPAKLNGQQKQKTADIKADVTALTSDLTAYTTFVNSLTGSGAGNLNAIAQAKTLSEAIAASGVVYINVHSAAGSVLTTKSLISSLGVTPISVSGGVVVSYSFVKAATRQAGLIEEITPGASIRTVKKAVRLDAAGRCDGYMDQLAKRYCPTHSK